MKPIAGARIIVEDLEDSCAECPARPGGRIHVTESTLLSDLVVGDVYSIDRISRSISGEEFARLGRGIYVVQSWKQLSENAYGMRTVTFAHTLGCKRQGEPIYWTAVLTVLSEPFDQTTKETP